MARLEAKGLKGVFTFVVPETSSAVLLVSPGRAPLARDLAPNIPGRSLIPASAIIQAAQGHLSFGPEDADNGGLLNEFDMHARGLPKDFDMDLLRGDLTRAIKEKLPQWGHIGEPAAALEGIVDFLAYRVLEIQEQEELKAAS